MSRRGKDDGFRPHPGDPWSPGWTSDEEPAAEEETAAVAKEPAPEPGPELETGAREAAVEGAAAEVEKTVAAGGIPAAEADDWTEVLGVRAEEPRPPVVPAASGESVPQALLDWAQGQLPLEVAPAVPGSEPEHLPPPWSPEEAEAELVAGAPSEPELVEAEMDHLPPSWAPEDPEAEPAAEAKAADVEPAGPGWANVAEDWVPAESSAAAGEEGAEVEVEEWLSFAGGAAAEAAAPAEQPMIEEAVQGVAEATPAAASRRRFWPFGRRGRPTEERPGEWPEEEWVAAEGGGEAPGLQPPPWSLETEEEVGPVGSGLLLPEEREETPVGVAAGEAEVEGWEQPVVEEPAAVAAGDWEPGEEAPPPPPWVDQSDLDRAAPIPIIPAGLPGDEPVIEPEGAGWAGGPAASPDSWAAEAEPSEGFPAAAADEEPTEEQEAFPELGRPAGADEPPSALGAPSGEWGEPVGIEAAGVPTTEIPLPEAAGYLTREEVFAGAVTSEHRDLAEEVAAADTAEAHLQALSAPMAGLESGVVGFEDVVYLGGEEEYVERPRSDLPIRVVTGMVLVGILLGAMWVGGEFLAGFVGLL
ncbi:MAG TPA: hypothetical protein VLS92_01065, partial [Acidimicrobiia bacterium]|nr:hypothetical protein [Acidimicrobiia bacterium]